MKAFIIWALQSEVWPVDNPLCRNSTCRTRGSPEGVCFCNSAELMWVAYVKVLHYAYATLCKTERGKYSVFDYGNSLSSVWLRWGDRAEWKWERSKGEAGGTHNHKHLIDSCYLFLLHCSRSSLMVYSLQRRESSRKKKNLGCLKSDLTPGIKEVLFSHGEDWTGFIVLLLLLLEHKYWWDVLLSSFHFLFVVDKEK